MPLCYCYTNLPDSDIPANFEVDFAKFIHNTLPNKPLDRISVVVIPGARVCKAGTTEPAMLVQLRSIAVFNKDSNPTYFPKFFDFLTSTLKLPENRFTIEFIDIEAINAMNGK